MKILAGGVVHTMAIGAAPADTVAFEGGRIVAVGRRDEVVAQVGAAEIVELGARAVVPGFIDAHHHVCLAVLFETTVSCDHVSAPTHDAIVARLAASATSVPAGEWVVGYGYDARRLPGGRPPTREHLDAACADRPVLLVHYSHHEGIASSLALRAVGIDRNTPDPPGGVIERDSRGEPTGRLIEAAFGLCEQLARESIAARNADQWVAGVVAHQRALFAAGITRVHDPIVHRDMEALYARARAEAGLRIPMIVSPLAPGGFLAADPSRLLEAPSGTGDDESRVGPVKIVLDGAERCAICVTWGQLVRSAVATTGRMIVRRTLVPARTAMLAPFRRSAGKLRRGLLFFDTEAARRCTANAAEHGFDPMIHAMGNAAVEMALDAIEAAPRRPERFPARIEHATFTTPALRARFAALGVVASAQATFVGLPDVAAAPSIAGMQMLALRSLVDAKIPVALSADHPATPFAPLYGMRCAVERQLFDGRIHAPDERLSVEQALAGYTRTAAMATGSLATCGTIEPGKRADLVVLSEDPYAPDALARVSIVETLLAGDTVFAASGSGYASSS